MKTIVTVSLLVVAGMLGANKITAQNQLHLSQFSTYKPFANPAAIADKDKLSAALLYKAQWVGVEGAPSFQALGFATDLGDQSNYAGLIVRNDRIGVNSVLNLAGTYAYQIELNPTTKLSFGLAGGVDILQSRLDEVPLNAANDPVFTSNTGNFIKPNFQFGTWFRKDRFYAGLSTPNLLKNRIIFNNGFEAITDFDFNDIHFYLMSGYAFELDPTKDLTVNSQFKHAVGSPLQIDLNVNLFIDNKVGFGLTYRSAKIVSALLSFVMAENLLIGYAYDYNFTPISDFSGGSHEVVLRYTIAQSSSDKAMFR